MRLDAPAFEGCIFLTLGRPSPPPHLRRAADAAGLQLAEADGLEVRAEHRVPALEDACRRGAACPASPDCPYAPRA